VCHFNDPVSMLRSVVLCRESRIDPMFVVCSALFIASFCIHYLPGLIVFGIEVPMKIFRSKRDEVIGN
jgi:hypothetical protein